MVDGFAREIQARLPENTWMLIVSDHGMETVPGEPGGIHSLHGFWSSSLPLGRKTINLLEFHGIILDMLRGEHV